MSGVSKTQLAQAMLQALPPAKPISVRQMDDEVQRQDRLAARVQELESVIRTTSNEEISVLNSILAAIQNFDISRASVLKNTGTSKKSTVSGTTIGDSSVMMSDALDKSLSKAFKGGKVPGMSGLSGGGGGKGGSPPVMSSGAGSGPNFNPKKFIGKLGMENIGTMLAASLGYAFAGAFDTFISNTGVELSSIFDGMIKEEFKFTTQMMKAANETRKFGDDLTDVTKQYVKFGNVVEETGHNRTEFQKVWLKNARKGFGFEMKAGKMQQKTADDQIRMLKNALNVSFELDMNAESTAELFDHWSRNLQLSNTQLYTIGLSMKQIARETGVSGENMMQVAKSVEETAKLLKKASALSHSTMSAMLRSAALASKYGIEDISQQIDQGLTSYDNFINMSDKKLQMFMTRALSSNKELWNALKAGVAGSEMYRPKVNKAMEDEIKKVLARSGMAGVDPTQIQGEMRKLELQMEAAKNAGNNALADQLMSQLFKLRTIPKQLGMEIGDFNALALKLKEESKTPLQRIDELHKQLQQSTNDVRSQKLQSDINELQQSITQSAIATYTEMANLSSNSLNDAIKQTRTKLIETGMLKSSDPFGAEQFRNVIKQNLNNLETEANRLDGGLFTEQLQLENFNSKEDLLNAFLSADADQRKRAQTAMESIANQVGVDQSVEDNPVMKINQLVKEINENIRKMTGAFIFTLSAGGLAAIIATGLTLKTVGGVVGGVQAFRAAKSMFGRGGAGGAGGVAGLPGGGGGGGGIPYQMPKQTGRTVQVPTNSWFGGTQEVGAGTVAHRKAVMSKSDRIAAINQRRAMRTKGDITPLSRTNIRHAAGRGSFAPVTRGGKTAFLGRTRGIGRGLAGKVGNLFARGMDLFNKVDTVANAAGYGGYGGAVPDMSGATPVYVVNFNEMGMGLPGGGLMTAVDTVDTVSDVGSMAKSMTRSADKLDDAAKSTGFFAKTMSKIKGTKMGGAMFGMTEKAGKALGGIGSRIAGSKIGSAVGGLAGKIGGMGAVKGAAQVAGKGAAFLAPILGGAFGFMEAGEAGRSKTEGTILGALTGGAKRGSMFSGMLGIEKGGMGDDLMGVAGAAGTGALAGAGIGTMVAGPVGTAVGAAIGGAVGLIGESYKVLTDENSQLGAAIKGFTSSIWDSTKAAGQAIWDFGGMLGEGAYKAWEGMKSFGSTLAEGATGLFDKVTSKVGGLVNGLVENPVEGAKNIALEGATAVTTMMNPFNWFQDGTRQIEQGGLAVLHEGEAVVPKSVWDSIVAVGSGAFGPIGGLLSGFKNPLDVMTGVGSGIKSIFNTSVISKLLNRGAFAKNEPRDAMMTAHQNDMMRQGLIGGSTSEEGQQGLDQLVAIRKLLEGGTISVEAGYLGRGAFDGKKTVNDALSSDSDKFLQYAKSAGMTIGQMETIAGTVYRLDAKSDKRSEFADFVKEKIDSSYLGRGAFDPSVTKRLTADVEHIKNSSLDMSTLGAVSEKEIESRKRDLEKITASVLNTGAFDKKSVSEAYSYDDLEVKMAQISSQDYNNILDSVRSRPRTESGLGRSLYTLDNGTDEEIDQQTLAANGSGNIDRELLRSFDRTINTNREVSVGATMYTPEDAADYVMQQMAGSTPSNSEAVGGLEYLSKLTEEQNYMMAEMLEELKKFNTARNTSSVSVFGGEGEERESKGQSYISRYKKNILRGNWEDLQAIAANRQDQLQLRPR